MPDGSCLNVNIPKLPSKDIKGIRICRQSNGNWIEVDERKDPAGRTYYWLTGTFQNYDSREDTDEWALANGYAAVVPVQYDVTVTPLFLNLKVGVMIKDQLFIRGAVLGFLIPSIAFMIYSLVRTDGDFVALYYELNALNIHTHVMSLCMYPMRFLSLFSLNQIGKPARGILMTTIVFALLITLDKFL